MSTVEASLAETAGTISMICCGGCRESQKPMGPYAQPWGWVPPYPQFLPEDKKVPNRVSICLPADIKALEADNLSGTI